MGYKAIDKIRSFLWRGRKDAKGGHCLVAWPKVCLPKRAWRSWYLQSADFGWALRMRWLRLKKVNPTRPWVFFRFMCIKIFRLSSLLQLSLLLEMEQGLFFGLIDGSMVSEWRTWHLKCLHWCPNEESIEGQYLKLSMTNLGSRTFKGH